MSYNHMEAWPRMPHNFYQTLEGFLWLHYASLAHAAEEEALRHSSMCERPMTT